MRFPLLPPPGLVSDDTAFASPGLWADASNVRFWRGKPQVIGGWLSAMSMQLEGVCRGILAWTDNAGFMNTVYATHKGLWVQFGGELFDITPAGYVDGPEHGAGGPGFGAGPYGEGPYGTYSPSEWFPRTWSLDNWGEQLVACYRRGPLYTWENDEEAPAEVIAEAPEDIISMVVTDSRQIMVGGCNMEASGDFNGLCIRWCEIEDKTNWTTSATNVAGEYILKGSGSIVALKRFGSDVLVWTDNAMWRAYYIGDTDTPWGFERIKGAKGLIGPNAVHIDAVGAYWISGDRQFYAYAPGGVPQPLLCPIRDEFANNLAAGQLEKICAVGVSKFGEVWWFYPDARDGVENSRYITVSTIDGAWSRGIMARSAAIDAGPLKFPLFVAPDGYAFSHENGDSANGAPLSWYIETADVYVDEASRCILISELWPDFEDQAGAISLTLKLRKYPQATVREKGPFLLQAGQAKKDMLVEGRVLAARFAGSSSPARARFGKPVFIGVPTSQQ